eukprot:TRINITY_DN11992_c0_g1_i1.p1 TRINITY_DN11992_c0_g1~~TRINITY_DN11992_c0_g1_i1.p1  ORF type:complete len:320 (-),score=81.60 TRINITY_DN11992_c0_g1_i1:103-1062(-)
MLLFVQSLGISDYVFKAIDYVKSKMNYACFCRFIDDHELSIVKKVYIGSLKDNNDQLMYSKAIGNVYIQAEATFKKAFEVVDFQTRVDLLERAGFLLKGFEDIEHAKLRQVCFMVLELLYRSQNIESFDKEIEKTGTQKIYKKFQRYCILDCTVDQLYEYCSTFHFGLDPKKHPLSSPEAIIHAFNFNSHKADFLFTKAQLQIGNIGVVEKEMIVKRFFSSEDCKIGWDELVLLIHMYSEKILCAKKYIEKFIPRIENCDRRFFVALHLNMFDFAFDAAKEAKDHNLLIHLRYAVDRFPNRKIRNQIQKEIDTFLNEKG